ncbi:hypothetical protein SAY87_013325 [Trapa incisa]|uniref:Protein SHORT HYPOCOTYL IN WHITE LIGHT 1 n=1 Tax=Trapa incisa TaxID=236973 RepID=A0AAN7KD57_9MYRT|nr:hypothetical protein SAY87_013325 [Trapa incisa]
MSSILLHLVTIATPITRLCRFNSSPPFGLSSSRQETRFPQRDDQKRNGPVDRVRCSGSRVSRVYGGPTEEEAAASAAASFFGGYDLAKEGESDDEEGGEDDDAESSFDLLIRFLQSMFGKVARQAKRASRSVLPPVIPQQLVSFAVDGILLLASLSIAKALLEVACTLGGTVFVVILLVRVIWAASSYFQSNGNSFNQAGTTFGSGKPAT